MIIFVLRFGLCGGEQANEGRDISFSWSLFQFFLKNSADRLETIPSTLLSKELKRMVLTVQYFIIDV